MAKKKKYYAVAAGKSPGIYTAWFGPSGAEKQVRGYPGAVYKGFIDLTEAEAFLEAYQEGKNKSQVRQKATETTKKVKSSHLRAIDQGKIIVYTDGGAIENPGPGGYGVVIMQGGRIKKEISKGYQLTTNNRMELMACIAGLQAFKNPSAIILFSDSRYVVNGIEKGWARKWQANGWMRTRTEPAVNPDLWEQLLSLCDKHDVEFRWVKGHAGIEANERCDELATMAASKPNLSADTVYEKNMAVK
ncbi:MAG: ribonuclease HI [Desulfobacterales bacterium]|nr:ribonuclease HI [Desulfobacterales bacterium]